MKGMVPVAFQRYTVRRSLVVDKLISFYYFELSKHFRYKGEKHDFWELLYVDKGEIELQTDSGNYRLKQGDLLVHEPNEFHSPRSNGKIAPNIMIVTFECASPAIDFFTRVKLFNLDRDEKELLTRMMEEGGHAFGPSPMSGDVRISPRQDEDSLFGSEQLFVQHLEQLLILLIRKGAERQSGIKPHSAPRENREAELFRDMVDYMKRNLGKKLTLDHLCADFAVGRTYVSVLFKRKLDCGVIEYWNQLRIEKAKEYIRENNFNLTEIAELLGYSSVHYFSRHFKKIAGITPSEYARTLHARMYRQRIQG